MKYIKYLGGFLLLQLFVFLYYRRLKNGGKMLIMNISTPMVAAFYFITDYICLLYTSYRPLINNTSISQYAYDNRWTPENPSGRFPRLTTEAVENNTQTSSVWLQDRSFLKLREVIK